MQLRKDILRKTKQELTWRSDAKATGKKIKKDGGCISFAPEKSSKSSKSSKWGPKSTYCQELRKTGKIRGQGTIHNQSQLSHFLIPFFFRFLFLPNGKLTSTSPLLKLFLLIIGLARVGILIKVWASLPPFRVDIDYGWAQKNGYTMKAIEAYDWSVHFYALAINEGNSEEIQKIQSKIYWIKRRSVYLAKMMDPTAQKACYCSIL